MCVVLCFFFLKVATETSPNQPGSQKFFSPLGNLSGLHAHSNNRSLVSPTARHAVAASSYSPSPLSSPPAVAAAYSPSSPMAAYSPVYAHTTTATTPSNSTPLNPLNISSDSYGSSHSGSSVSSNHSSSNSVHVEGFELCGKSPSPFPKRERERAEEGGGEVLFFFREGGARSWKWRISFVSVKCSCCG